jgi:hypothetical protein
MPDSWVEKVELMGKIITLRGKRGENDEKRG